VNKDWSVYILTCRDGTLYCGVSNDVRRRVAVHNAGKGAKYTRSRLPVTVLVERVGLSKRDAMRLEAFVKRQPRTEKVKRLSEWTP
jgi:putative endonuclease